MLSMADHKTGELRHREHWFNAAYIEREADICDRLRKKYMRELVNKGYVKMERIRNVRNIRGRKRAVLGETHYTVFKEPHKHSVSSTVTSSMVTSGNRSRKSPTSLSVRHQEDALQKGVGVSGLGSDSEHENPNHHLAEADDDRVRSNSLEVNPNPFLTDEENALISKVSERLREKHGQVWTALETHCKDYKLDISDWLHEAFELIDDRGDSTISAPAAYFSSGVVRILESGDADCLKILETVREKQRRRSGAGISQWLNKDSDYNDYARRRFAAITGGKASP
jgi:hypothetical protein